MNWKPLQMQLPETHLRLKYSRSVALRNHNKLDGDAARAARMRVCHHCRHNRVGGLVSGVQDGHQRLGGERAPAGVMEAYVSCSL